MKIMIELSDVEVKGIKNYLKEVDGISRPSKMDVKLFIDSIVQSIHAPQEAVSDYIKAAGRSNEHSS